MTDDYALELPEPTYEGETYSADDVETLRREYQGRHQTALDGVKTLDGEYDELATAVRAGLDDERWQRQLEALSNSGSESWLSRTLRRAGLKKRERPLSEVLEEQLESVQERVHHVVRLRESLDQHATQIEEDIRRLNTRITDAAHNEERAAAHVLALSKALADSESALLYSEHSHDSARYREASAHVDELKAQIRLHGTRARSFGRAENRLASIVLMNRNFLEMLQSSAENMEQLANASSQVVDEISGNVRALAKVALAGEVATDLMEATRRLKDGVNRVATAASTTSLQLTRDIDSFVADMSVYDQDTIELVEENMTEERRVRQAQVDAAIAHAYENALVET